MLTCMYIMLHRAHSWAYVLVVHGRPHISICKLKEQHMQQLWLQQQPHAVCPPHDCTCALGQLCKNVILLS